MKFPLSRVLASVTQHPNTLLPYPFISLTTAQMAISARCSSIKVSSAGRRSVRPVAALNGAKIAAAGVATVALAAAMVAPAEAAQVMSTIASAAEGYPFVSFLFLAIRTSMSVYSRGIFIKSLPFTPPGAPFMGPLSLGANHRVGGTSCGHGHPVHLH
jgi:hypothetical protein